MFKSPRALDTFFGCQSNENVYLRQNSTFLQLLFAAIFLKQERQMVPIDIIPLSFTVSYRSD